MPSVGPEQPETMGLTAIGYGYWVFVYLFQEVQLLRPGVRWTLVMVSIAPRLFIEQTYLLTASENLSVGSEAIFS